MHNVFPLVVTSTEVKLVLTSGNLTPFSPLPASPGRTFLRPRMQRWSTASSLQHHDRRTPHFPVVTFVAKSDFYANTWYAAVTGDRLGASRIP